MKNLFALAFILLAHTSFAQIVAGLYAGTLVNDSTRKEQRYELALSEYRGKITGYSYTTFVANDTFYYSIKRVKGTRKDNEILVEDDKMIANNFPESPAKGVRQINHIALTNEDTLRTVKASWETTRTKVYYSLHGQAEMKWSNDSSQSALVSHLKELGIINQAVYRNDDVSNTKSDIRNTKNEIEEREAQEQRKKELAAAKAAEKEEADKKAAEARAKKQQEKEEKMLAREKKKSEAEEARLREAEEKKKQEAALASQKAEEKKTREEKEAAAKAASAVKASVVNTKPAPMPIAERKKNILPAYETSADSLELSFYDNGVIDGDSISVYLNGEPVFINTKLTAVATKKKIALPKTETIELLLVAENLGTLPPNTGLVMIKDGGNSYQLHFSADLQTNASITIKRKK